MARNFIHPPERELLLLHVLQNYQKKKKKKNRMKEIQTYIRACDVEFTKGLSYYRV